MPISLADVLRYSVVQLLLPPETCITTYLGLVSRDLLQLAISHLDSHRTLWCSFSNILNLHAHTPAQYSQGPVSLPLLTGKNYQHSGSPPRKTSYGPTNLIAPFCDSGTWHSRKADFSRPGASCIPGRDAWLTWKSFSIFLELTLGSTQPGITLSCDSPDSSFFFYSEARGRYFHCPAGICILIPAYFCLHVF